MGTLAPNDPRNPYGGIWLDLGNNVAIHGTSDEAYADHSNTSLSLAPRDAEDVWDSLAGFASYCERMISSHDHFHALHHLGIDSSAGAVVGRVHHGVCVHAPRGGVSTWWDSPAVLVKILPYIIPQALVFALPATVLLAVCVVYGRISSSNGNRSLKIDGHFSMGNHVASLFFIIFVEFVMRAVQ